MNFVIIRFALLCFSDTESVRGIFPFQFYFFQFCLFVYVS